MRPTGASRHEVSRLATIQSRLGPGWGRQGDTALTWVDVTQVNRVRS